MDTDFRLPLLPEQNMHMNISHFRKQYKYFFFLLVFFDRNMISVPLSFLDDNSFFGLDLDFLEVKQTPAPLPSLFSFLFT